MKVYDKNTPEGQMLDKLVFDHRNSGKKLTPAIFVDMANFVYHLNPVLDDKRRARAIRKGFLYVTKKRKKEPSFKRTKKN